jgi:predicted amidohydrolase YtcJ
MPYGPFGRQLYGQTDPASRGTLFIEPSKLLQILRAARDKGWQLSAHVQGGGAIDALLDAFEQLDRERPIAPTRSHVIHGSMQSPASIARMRKLGILANVQPDWLYFDVPALSKVFGLENLRWFYPLRSYIDNGIIVSGGSDQMIGLDKNRAVNPYNPFLNMWMSITRRTAAGDVVFPEECITREEALKMYTIWAAYMQFAEKSRGSIEPGKLADLVVVDRDFLTCPVDQIKDIEPVMTIVGGKVVFGGK